MKRRETVLLVDQTVFKNSIIKRQKRWRTRVRIVQWIRILFYVQLKCSFRFLQIEDRMQIVNECDAKSSL